MSKYQQLQKIANQVKVCPRCRLSKNRKKAVPGEGDFDAKIMFIGESPGRFEDVEGRPFVGPAGKYLNKLLALINLKRENVFITSVIKCHPPKNRNPKDDELAACRIYWKGQVSLIKPKIVVLLGRIAAKEVLGIEKIKENRKVVVKGKIKYFLTYHPAAGMRFPKVRKEMRKDFLRLAKLIREFA
jgi:DNA polymerase